jgi:integral membrane protein
MPLKPTYTDTPRIRGALKLYRVTSIITGTFLLLLCLMMVFRYLFLVDIELGGAFGFLALQPRAQIKAIDLSTGILIAHGWFYVLYLISDFRLWSIMRWDFKRFLLIALGGVIPLLSFFMERRVHRQTIAEVIALESQPTVSPTPAEAAH